MNEREAAKLLHSCCAFLNQKITVLNVQRPAFLLLNNLKFKWIIWDLFIRFTQHANNPEDV